MYQSNVASSPSDLLTRLVDFMTANGWTTDISRADGAGRRACLHKGGIYVYLRALMNEPAGTYGLYVCMGTGYNDAAAWNVQPGVPGPISFMGSPGVVAQTYYFFADASGDNVFIVLKYNAVGVTYLGFGTSLTKAGTYTGGQYYCASGDAPAQYAPFFNGLYGNAYSGNHLGEAFVRADVDAYVGGWLTVGPRCEANSTPRAAASPIAGGYPHVLEIPNYATLDGRLTATLDAQAVLLPIPLYASRDSQGYSLLGTVPNVFVANAVGRGYALGATYSLGAENFTLFPLFAVKKV